MATKRQSVVVFDEINHTYFNTNTKQFMTSVSKLKEIVKVPFDDNMIAGVMAGAELKKLGGGSEAEFLSIKNRIMAGWLATKKKATDRGTLIHKIIEDLIPFLKEPDLALNCRIVDACGGKNYHKAVTEIIFSLRKYSQNCSEFIVYSEEYNVCGTLDHGGVRQNTKTSLVDIDDWKTNEFTYDSIKIKDGMVKHYNKMLLPPLQHLEESKYTDLALQLSVYGVLGEITYGWKIGKLTGHNIDHEGVYRIIPVPYMRMEALALLEHKKSLKALPTLASGNDQPIDDDSEW